MAASQGKALLNEFSYGKLARVFTKTAKTRVIFSQSLCKITADNRSLPDKYKFGVKDSLSGINKAQSEVSDGLPATHKMPSEPSDGFTAFNKMPSETSDGLPATNKILSEVSDTLPAIDGMPSETSDAFTAIDKALSEPFDTFIATYRMPSEASDGFAATNDILSEVSDTSTASEKYKFSPNLSSSAFKRNEEVGGLKTQRSFYERNPDTSAHKHEQRGALPVRLEHGRAR